MTTQTLEQLKAEAFALACKVSDFEKANTDIYGLDRCSELADEVALSLSRVSFGDEEEAGDPSTFEACDYAKDRQLAEVMA